MLDPNGIPAPVVATDAVTSLLATTRRSLEAFMPAGSEAGTVSARDCQDAMRNLARLSLLNLSQPTQAEGGGFARIRVHALVQRATTEKLTPDQVAPLVTAAADALIEIWPEVERDRQLGQILRSNTATLAGRHPSALWVPDGHLVLWQAGDSLGESGLVTIAIDYWTELVDASTDHLGPDHVDTLTARNSLAYWRGEAGDSAGAVAAFEQLRADRLRVLGPDHVDTLTARNNFAYFRGEAGDPAGAFTAFEQLLADRLRVLGPDHPHTLTTRNILARWQGEVGDPPGAVTAYEQLLADRLRVLGPDHHETLGTRYNLAHWLGKTGDPAGTVTAYERLLADRLRVVGPDHPETLSTRDKLAHWRGEAGNPAGAVAAYEQLLADYMLVLGPDHPHALTARNNLARWRGRAADS
jgi:hypothetical protein